MWMFTTFIMIRNTHYLTYFPSKPFNHYRQWSISTFSIDIQATCCHLNCLCNQKLCWYENFMISSWVLNKNIWYKKSVTACPFALYALPSLTYYVNGDSQISVKMLISKNDAINLSNWLILQLFTVIKRSSFVWERQNCHDERT